MNDWAAQDTPTPPPWYADGLQFECRRCGRCCGGSPGTVRVTAAEIATMAATLGESEADFAGHYLRTKPGVDGYCLTEKTNYDCIFFEPGVGCRVYTCRPRQCQTWPFWRMNLRSAGAWNVEAAACPGMNHGRHYTEAEIGALSANDGTPASAGP